MTDKTKNPAPLAPTSADKGASSVKPKVREVLKGKLVKKTGNAKGASDPYTQAKPSRTKTTASGGARYGIRVKFQKSTAPEAGATQANGRIIASAVNRSKPNFTSGAAD